ncbi:MAG: hypothetical protein M8841_00275 [marine benthic group bacterium]|nr:hypothetical protein [Gemmatimonadota bacterium]
MKEDYVDQIDRGAEALGCDRGEFVRLACVMLAAELGLDETALTQPANLTERPGPSP